MNNGHLTDLTSDAQDTCYSRPPGGLSSCHLPKYSYNVEAIAVAVCLSFGTYVHTEQALVKQTSATVLVQLFQIFPFQQRYYMILLSVTGFVLSNFESRFN